MLAQELYKGCPQGTPLQNNLTKRKSHIKKWLKKQTHMKVNSVFAALSAQLLSLSENNTSFFSDKCSRIFGRIIFTFLLLFIKKSFKRGKVIHLY